MRHAMAIALVLLIPLAASTAHAQEIRWENRGQPEFNGAAVDIDGEGQVVVASGRVSDGPGLDWWFIRAVDRKTGATRWEDRFGPGDFNLAKDVAVDDGRAFAAGWTASFSPINYDFVVRAYDLLDGRVLWAHQLDLGPFNDTAKVVTARHGRVFVGGYLTSASGGADFALLTFDAGTGALLWQSVTDPTGMGRGGAVWAVTAHDHSVFVLGEIGPVDQRSLFLRAHDVRTGVVRWERVVPGARNDTLKDTLAADSTHVFIAGQDENGDFMVRAYDAQSGRLSWADRVDDGDRLGQAESLSVGAGDRVYATGVVGCNPETFVECKLAIRAYDARKGLVWKRTLASRGGDWGYPLYVAAAGDQVFFGGGELLEDGQYHGMIRAFTARSGASLWQEPFDEGSNPPGFLTLSVIRDQLFVAGTIFRGPDFSGDFVLRRYRTR